MIDNGDKLREAFERHENDTPDPAAVYARVQELSRGYQRRRWGAQAAGGAVLGAGLIAGVITLPGLLPGPPAGGSGNGAMVAPAAAPATPAPTPSSAPPARSALSPSLSPKEAELQEQWDAYFGAGYDYDDAVQLAKIWKMTKKSIGTVKAAAGEKLLAGKKLPIEPGSAPDAPDAPASQEQKQVDAFFEAGYDYDDAVQLAKIWKKADPYSAKILGGKKLLAGETLPVQP